MMTPTPTPIEPKWTDELRIYGEGFVGRQDELAALDRAWGEGARIFVLHAEAGAGKTRVVAEWLRRMRDDGWRGARRVFVHSFYSQGSDERRNATSELFFEQALAYFGHEGELILQADEKGRTLAQLLVVHHGLLVLDGLEPLQHPTYHERGRLKDPGIARLLLSLANAPGGTPGLCLITSRQPVVEIEGRMSATILQRSLDHLRRDDGAELLRQFQVAGPDEELKKASDEFLGHAYSLMLLGSYLRNATDHHDIRGRREVALLEEDTKHEGHARHMFAAYVRHLGEHSPEVAVLRLLGFFDRPAERQLLDVLRAREGMVYEWSKGGKPADRRSQPKHIEDALPEVTGPLLDLTQAQWHRVLNRLRDLRLIDFTGPAVDAHPLLREYFAEQVRTQFPAAWQAGHQRLVEHLSGTLLESEPLLGHARVGEEATPAGKPAAERAAAESSPAVVSSELDPLLLAFLLVLSGRAKPQLLINPDRSSLLQAVSGLTLEIGVDPLLEAQKVLAREYPNASPNALWVAWMRASRGPELERIRELVP